jgi:transcription elongation GreA/GreB family factor
LENTKSELYKLCQSYLEQRISTAREAILAVQRSANEETKSSSGDKHETGRAMMQLEIEKDAAQLAEALKLKTALDKINIHLSSGRVQPGSVVTTNHGIFFIAISVGKITLHGETYICISPSSPLGIKLRGTQENDLFTFNQREYRVEKIA